MMISRSQQQAAARATHAQRVVQRLAAHFDDLADPATAEVVATSIAAYLAGPAAGLPSTPSRALA
ncbi:hypothetical protein [Nonomuraea jabiensis]|uniref:Uncharacterized protein n=1 Tax=Nonomuraea jabiensis TaxID=882448 RepID=A0A7W9GDS9_9ACTN|nr:hypothetical protein [Nonomuraea jabiensis]MBB5781955.1 hypothetical protein [Nonomuraea jabiensis]